jgi:hypothetical protein
MKFSKNIVPLNAIRNIYNLLECDAMAEVYQTTRRRIAEENTVTNMTIC